MLAVEKDEKPEPVVEKEELGKVDGEKNNEESDEFEEDIPAEEAKEQKSSLPAEEFDDGEKEEQALEQKLVEEKV